MLYFEVLGSSPRRYQGYKDDLHGDRLTSKILRENCILPQRREVNKEGKRPTLLSRKVSGRRQTRPPHQFGMQTEKKLDTEYEEGYTPLLALLDNKKFRLASYKVEEVFKNEPFHGDEGDCPSSFVLHPVVVSMVVQGEHEVLLLDVIVERALRAASHQG